MVKSILCNNNARGFTVEDIDDGWCMISQEELLRKGLCSGELNEECKEQSIDNENYTHVIYEKVDEYEVPIEELKDNHDENRPEEVFLSQFQQESTEEDNLNPHGNPTASSSQADALEIYLKTQANIGVTSNAVKKPKRKGKKGKRGTRKPRR